MNQAQENYMLAVLTACGEQGADLNDWERGFMSDQQARYDKYAGDMFMSPKQWNIVHKIASKLGVERIDLQQSSDDDLDDEIPF